MPIYEWKCETDKIVIEELRKMGDLCPPKCSVCLNDMERVFSSSVTILDITKVPAKLKKRSEEQGKRFFRRYPKYQDMVTKTLNTKGE